MVLLKLLNVMKKTSGCTALTIRPALASDVPALRIWIERSARTLSVGFYTQQQTEALVRDVFGIDSQLIEDATFLLVEADGVIVACGGWGRRSTSFGGDQASGHRNACSIEQPRRPRLAPSSSIRRWRAAAWVHC